MLVAVWQSGLVRVGERQWIIAAAMGVLAAVMLGVAVYCVVSTLLVIGVLASMGTSWRAKVVAAVRERWSG